MNQLCKRRRELRILPPTIAVFTNILNARSEKKEVAWSIPERFDFSTYIFEEDDEDVDQEVKKDREPYEAFAIISMDGPDLKNSSYTALIKKHNFDDQTFQWYQFSQVGVKPITSKEALRDYRPQAIFFRKKPKRQHFDFKGLNKKIFKKL